MPLHTVTDAPAATLHAGRGGPHEGVQVMAHGRGADVAANVAGIEGLAASERGFQQIPAPQTGICGLPYFVARQAGNRLDTRLSAFTPLQHDLESFQRMETVDFDPTVGGHQGILDRRLKRQFQLRPSPRHRQTGACHKRKLQFLTPTVHLLGTRPTIR